MGVILPSVIEPWKFFSIKTEKNTKDNNILFVSVLLILFAAITCPDEMPAIDNAVGTPNDGGDGQIDIDDTGTYMCDDNFTPSGTAGITCNNENNQGVWGSTDFTCSRE